MILADTCALIWDALDRSKLTADAKNAIELNEQDRTATVLETIW